jgi:hypothetical protein
MADYVLYRLHLAAPLKYLPHAGTDLVSLPRHAEIVLAWDPAVLVREDPEEGPCLHLPLPAPNFSGYRTETRTSGESGTQDTGIEAGEYLFMQWRPAAAPEHASGIFTASREEIEAGIDYFIRQVWWEGEKTRGPWYFRALEEDGKTAFQALRALSR